MIYAFVTPDLFWDKSQSFGFRVGKSSTIGVTDKHTVLVTEILRIQAVYNSNNRAADSWFSKNSIHIIIYILCIHTRVRESVRQKFCRRRRNENCTVCKHDFSTLVRAHTYTLSTYIYTYIYLPLFAGQTRPFRSLISNYLGRWRCGVYIPARLHPLARRTNQPRGRPLRRRPCNNCPVDQHAAARNPS